MEPADILVHECTFLAENADKADEYLHSTTLGALENALNSKSRFLALTHYSARIDDIGKAGSEVIQNLGGKEPPICTLNDGDRLQISEDGDIKHLIKKGNGWE